MNRLLPLLPALSTFGPIFIVMGASQSDVLGRIVGYAGAAMTAGAFFLTLGVIRKLSEEIEALRSR